VLPSYLPAVWRHMYSAKVDCVSAATGLWRLEYKQICRDMSNAEQACCFLSVGNIAAPAWASRRGASRIFHRSAPGMVWLVTWRHRRRGGSVTWRRHVRSRLA